MKLSVVRIELHLLKTSRTDVFHIFHMSFRLILFDFAAASKTNRIFPGFLSFLTAKKGRNHFVGPDCTSESISWTA